MSAYQAGPETFLTLRYQVFDAEGEAIGAPDVLGCVFGMGQLLPAVEQALDGQAQGASLRTRLREKDAFGARDPSRILEVDSSDFPPDVAPGDRFEVENEHGGVLVLQVLDVQQDVVVVDTNHPLAGQDVELALELLEVRPATSEEIEAAVLALEEDEADFEGLGALGPSGVISPAALIRGR